MHRLGTRLACASMSGMKLLLQLLCSQEFFMRYVTVLMQRNHSHSHQKEGDHCVCPFSVGEAVLQSCLPVLFLKGKNLMAEQLSCQVKDQDGVLFTVP